MTRPVMAALVSALALTISVSAAAPFEVQVKELRAPDDTVSATVELRDVLPERFRKVVEDGGVLHLRLQTELWQRRTPWDRLVYPAIVRVLRFTRGSSSREVAVAGAGGSVASYGTLPNPMPISLMFWAGPGNEPAMIKVASAYETATHHRVPPPAFGPVRGEP